MVELKDIWTAAGVLLGFQITVFVMRLQREIAVGDRGDLTWLVPTDYLNLAGIVVLSFGVFVIPLVETGGQVFALRAFGLAVIFFVGYVFGLAGHYELFNPRTSRSHPFWPLQEKIALLVVAVCCILYSWLSLRQ